MLSFLYVAQIVARLYNNAQGVFDILSGMIQVVIDSFVDELAL